MKKILLFFLFFLFNFTLHSELTAQQKPRPSPAAKPSTSDLPKIAVWDLAAKNISADHASILTSILVSEVNNLKKYEVISFDNIRALTGWTAEKMKLGCNDTQCLTALGQMDIAKLISGNVGKIGNTYSVSLSLFDTQKTRAENHISETCRSEDELIGMVKQAVIKLLGEVPPGPKDGDTMRDSITSMEFIFIKGGCFDRGDTFGDGDSDERPFHEVCVGGFWMGKFEVTQGQWERVMGNNPSYFKSGSNYPVEQVSWNDTQEFIQRLNQQSGKRFRLPTEAEWEYAARSKGRREKWVGTSSEYDLGDHAWYDKNSGYRTNPVGQKKPNELGLYDMSGNVWEWCKDWYDKDYYSRRVRDNPKGPDSGQYRVLRGGSWFDSPRSVRASLRFRLEPTIRNSNGGFRLVLPSE
jgi:formylglycine-generating enzyme required for sulfatase activity